MRGRCESSGPFFSSRAENVYSGAMERQALLARAAAAFAAQDLAAAERDCRTLLASAGDDPDATHLMGLICRRRGDPAGAEAFLLRSLQAAPGRAEFRANFGNLLRSTGRSGEAEQQYRAAIDLDPAARPARLALARLLLESGRPEQAAAEARLLTTRNPQDAEAWQVLGSAQRALGRLDDAESSLRRSLALRPGYAVARHNLGALLGQMQRAEESLRELEAAAALGVTGRELQFNRARALLELGRLEEAQAALRAALQAAPGDIDSHMLLAKLLFMRGEPDFLRDFRQAAMHPDRLELRLAFGDLLRRSGRLEEAEAEVRAFIAGHGWSPALGASLAVVLQEQGRLDEARREGARALDARPHDPEIVANQVAVLLQLGEHALALPLVLDQRRRSPLDQRWLAYEATASRIAGTARYRELYDYGRFVRQYELQAGSAWPSIAALHAELVPRLVERHRFENHPLDQSLRLGSQTSRSLLADPDPVIRDVVRAFEAPITAYRAEIGADPSHPYLARNQGRTRLTGCWSVRLRRGGYHVNHVHPEGWISSAYYVEVPAETADPSLRSGWIKFGEPRMPVPGLGPDHLVQPQAGRLVLFPSYMWHGTTPISGDEPRMTIAFDAVTEAV
jgi:Tfp pilus assembly protein PilF